MLLANPYNQNKSCHNLNLSLLLFVLFRNSSNFSLLHLQIILILHLFITFLAYLIEISYHLLLSLYIKLYKLYTYSYSNSSSATISNDMSDEI
jgi:hypothetical protein